MVITDERLEEMVSFGREAMPLKAELKELIDSYRQKTSRVIVKIPDFEINKGSDGAWMVFRSRSGNSAVINVKNMAESFASQTARETIFEWEGAL